MTRDELVECAALLAAVRAGRLDATCPPVAPLDILAQQIVAEVAAADEWDEDGLFELVRRSAPYAELDREPTSTPWSSWCPRGSPPAGASAWPTCTATA